MKKNKKRIFILLLCMLLFILILLIAGYFLYSWLRLNDKGIPHDYLTSKTFITQDGETQLSFDEAAEYATLRTTDSFIQYTVSDYTENIITLANAGESIFFIIIDYQTLYGGHGIYLFLFGG